MRPSRHASADEIAALAERLARFQFLMRRMLRSLPGHTTLAPGARGLLTDIGAGCSAVPELAELRSVSRQAIQKSVDELAARGLVTARSDPADGRRRKLQLTPAGSRLLDTMRRAEQELAAANVGLIGRPELDVTNRVLDKLEQALADRSAA